MLYTIALDADPAILINEKVTELSEMITKLKTNKPNQNTNTAKQAFTTVIEHYEQLLYVEQCSILKELIIQNTKNLGV